MQIENVTIYNEETIKEIAKVLTRKYKSIVAGGVGFLAAIAIFYTLSQRKVNATILAAYAIGIIFLIVLGSVRVKKYEKNIFQRIKVINHQENVECRYAFDDEKTVISVAERCNTLYHTDIKKMIITANNYIMIYTGDIFSVVSKNGFDESGHQAFCELFKEHLQKGK